MTHGELAQRAAAALRAGRPSDGVLDLVVVGAGPSGLVTAHAAWEAGLDFLLLERENLAAHWRRYPGDMTLLSTRDETELPGFGLGVGKPYISRQEAIDYFVSYARHLGLDRFVVPRTTIEGLEGEAGAFRLLGRHTETGGPREVACRAVVLATGAHSVPKPLGVPGEDLPFVRRWFGAGSDHVGEDVVVVGAGNSAVESAIELIDHGARSVTVLVRAAALQFYRETRDLADVREGSEGRLRGLAHDSRLRVVTGAELTAVASGHVTYRTQRGEARAPADFVYALTGYGYDDALLKAVGVPFAEDGPRLSPDRETGRRGVYFAGSSRFIQHFRDDGRVIVAHAMLHHLPKRGVAR